MSLTEERINEMKEIFSMVDDDGDGSITRSQLGMCLRAMQYSISNGEINDFMKKFDSDKTGTISFPQLLQIIAATGQPNITKEVQTILSALKLFDTQNDGSQISLLFNINDFVFLFLFSIETISENDFRFLMQQTGEQLSKDSVDDMIKATDARTKNGRIQYRKLVSTLVHL
jgi:calmodulin